MIHLDRDTKNIVVGAALGSAVGVGASLLCTKYWRNNKNPLDSLAKTICHIGDAMDHMKKEGKPVVHEAEQCLHKKETTLSEVAGLVAEGIKLWQRFKN